MADSAHGPERRLYKIMIVDDEADVREGIVSLIDWDGLGYLVTAEAENGWDALEKAESQRVDVVLTDIRMPFLDGLEMSRQLTKLYPGVLIIILSGYDEFEYAKAAIRLNVVEYVLKPVNVAELSEVLAKVKQRLDDGIAQQQNIDFLQGLYQESLPLTRERFLTELMWGMVPEGNIEHQLKRYGLHLDGAVGYAVALFEVGRSKKSRVAKELIPVLIRQIVEKELDGRCRSTVFFSSLYIIAVTAWETKDPAALLVSLANEVCEHCQQVLDIVVTAGIGRTYPTVRQTGDSFLDAREALEYKAVTGEGNAIYIHDMERIGHPVPVLEDQDEERLTHMVKFGSAEQRRLYISEIAGRFAQLDEWGRQMYAYSLFGILYRLVHRYDLSQAAGIRPMLVSFRSVTDDIKDGAPVCAWLSGLCEALSELISSKRESAPRNLVAEAKRFIGEHYAEFDLSVDRLCGHLYVSQSYFSTVFKRETGTSYVQYLTELRLNRAVELLKTTDEKTYYIARLVGYDEPNYFSYVFKKKYGVPPTKYRGADGFRL